MATPSLCLGRLVDDKYVGWFGDKKHKFHIEICCGKPVVATTQLCGRCHTRPKELQKNHPTMLHGLVTEAIPPWSHVFGGSWYQAKVTEYGLPSEEEMGRAKKAHQDIIDSLSIKLTSVDVKLKNELIVPSPSVSTKSEDTPKTKRKYERKQIPVATAVTPQQVTTLAIEANEPIQYDFEVKKCVVRKIVHDGITYFLDASKEKVYSAGVDGRPLAYIGRWNARNQTIHTDISDSDEEN